MFGLISFRTLFGSFEVQSRESPSLTPHRLTDETIDTLVFMSSAAEAAEWSERVLRVGLSLAALCEEAIAALWIRGLSPTCCVK